MKKYFLLAAGVFCIQLLHAQDPAYPDPPAPPQNIIAAEYFIDTDPGVGSATGISLTASQNISNLNFLANTTGLANGYHRLFVRTKNAEGSWVITIVSDFIYNLDPGYTSGPTSQNISKAEYVVDNNIAFGSGTDIPVSSSANISNQAASVNVNGLINGIHRLQLRTRSTDGIWSITNLAEFLVDLDPGYPLAPVAPANIVKAEYVMDNNIPFGSGTNIPVTAGTNISNLAFNADVSSLTNNTHYLQLRMLNAEGNWSVTAVKDFIIFLDANPPYPPAPAPAANIVKAEYVMDNNVAFGSGTNIPIAANANISNLAFNADVNGLSDNTHYLQLRTLNAEGHWSVTAVKDFIIFLDANPPYPPAPVPAGNIVKAEYVLDNNIAFGSGTNIPIVANTNISNLVFSAAVNGLSDNTHYLQLRTLNAEGNWAVTNVRDFIIFLNADPQYPDAPLPLENIVRAEYFLDTDPGFGNGSTISLTPGTDISNLNFSVNTAALADGNHKIFVRSKDDWSITSSVIFLKGSVVPLKFLSLSAYNRDLVVDLEFKTGDETNTSVMTIERSTDGLSFQSIGQLPASNSSGEHNYFFKDAHPLKGMAWYRIRETDLNGNYYFSKTVLVNRSEKSDVFSVFPNPVKDRTVLTFAQSSTARKLTLTDTRGRLLGSWDIVAGATASTIDISAVLPGTYFITLRDNDGSTTKKILKQ